MTLPLPCPSARRGFTLLELLCTVAIIGILAALLLPALQSAHGQAKRIACANNLKQIGIAFSIWAHEHNDLFPMQVRVASGGTFEFAQATMANPNASFTFKHFQAVSNELTVAKVLRCPADDRRAAATNFAALGNEHVSYWINLGARYGQSSSPLAGDRNVRTSGRTEWTFLQLGAGDVIEFSAQLHGHRGNVLFADRHVELLDSVGLSRAFTGGSNTTDTTVSLPRENPDPLPQIPGVPDSGSPSTPPGSSQSQSSPNQQSASPQHSRPPTVPPGSRSAGGAAQQANASGNDTSTTRNGSKAGEVRTSPGVAQEGPVIVKLLDGSVVTAAPPAMAVNAFTERVPRRNEDSVIESPLTRLAASASRTAARNTPWLLLLLLLAVIAFFAARRQSARRRFTGRRFPNPEEP